MKYTTTDFFIIYCCLDHVYVTQYTNLNLTVYGDCLQSCIMNSINGESFICLLVIFICNHITLCFCLFRQYLFQDFLSKLIGTNSSQFASTVVKETLLSITQTFSRMRGGDIIWSLMSGNKSSVKLHTRQHLASVADPSTYKLENTYHASPIGRCWWQSR